MSATKLLCLCISILLLAVSGSQGSATDPLSKASRRPASLETTVQDFQSAVLKEGYEVARGYWILWGADDCKLPLQSVGLCYGNNPTAPYVLAIVPPWKNEFVDQSMQHALVQGQRGMVANYRLGEREALVILAQMPPPARYFGMGTNVFTRQAEVNKKDPVYVKLDTPLTQDLLGIIFGASPNPNRLMMMATFGDTINNVVIDNQSAGSWGEPRFFVITPDRQMAKAMTDAFQKAGIDKTLVLTEPAGFVNPDDATKPQLLRLGYGPEADDFITYIRYSMPNDPVLGDKWREQLPLTLLRVRDPNGGKARDAYKIQQYEAKS